MNKIHKLILSVIFVAAIAAVPSKAFADCQPVYGGGETCTSYAFSIQKFVQVPGKGGGNYVNNLSVSDPKYFASQQVNFRIVVQNTGSQTIPTINVIDTLPQYVTFVSGPGTFNSNNDTLSFAVNNLNPGQSATYYVSTKVLDSDKLPSDQGIFCPINQVSATDTNGFTNSTSSQFCIERNVLGAIPTIVSTPSTGPEVLPLALLLPGGLGGLILRKKSIKSVDLKGGEK